MKNIIHLTSNKNFGLIKQKEILEARTNPDNFEFGIGKKLKETIKFSDYLVGIPENSIKFWEDAGLKERLSQYTSNEISLSVPIKTKEGFVRDHFLYSPLRIKQDYSIDLSDEDYQDSLFDEEFNPTKEGKKVSKIVNECKRDYYNSSIKINDYKDNFKAPEVWIHQNTPLNLINKVNLN
jgi:hypothetical protein